jgi:hypothetical protein
VAGREVSIVTFRGWPKSGHIGWVGATVVTKEITFWQKHSPNCDFSVLHSPSTLSTSKNIWWVGPTWGVRRARFGWEKFSIVFAPHSIDYENVMLHTRSCPHWRSTHPFLRRFNSHTIRRLWVCCILLDHAHIEDQHIIPSFVDSIRLVLQDHEHNAYYLMLATLERIRNEYYLTYHSRRPYRTCRCFIIQRKIIHHPHTWSYILYKSLYEAPLLHNIVNRIVGTYCKFNIRESASSTTYKLKRPHDFRSDQLKHLLIWYPSRCHFHR